MTNISGLDAQHDAVVIGAGLFGSIIAAELRSKGLDVVILDAKREGAGSKPAACLMKPSWFSGMGEKATLSLELLDRLYKVHNIRFKVGPGHATVHWCDPATILKGCDIEASVGNVLWMPGERRWMTIASTLDGWALPPIYSKLVVVAAGIWTEQIVELPDRQVGQKGMALLLPKWNLHEPFIRPWAPYKQIVAFNRGDGIWVGDGSAIKAENWTAQREEQIFERCRDAVGRSFLDQPQRLIGIRPYYPRQKTCYLDRPRQGLWIATGGAKNGTIAAGWCAAEISRREA